MLERRTRKYGIVLLVIALLASYAYYESRGYLHGPQLSIVMPSDGFSVTDDVLVIEGTATNITDITLNDRPIFVDEDGHFKEDVLLMAGYNVLTLAVTDRYERTNVQYVRGVYTPTDGGVTKTSFSTSTLEKSSQKDEGIDESVAGTSSTTTLEPNVAL